MMLQKGIPVRLGTIHGTIFGGPFRNYETGTRRLVGVKMAAEIDHPHEFKVDTEDFSVPPVKDMQAGLIFAIEALADGNDIYVGCMGGIGRTGLFMGCMAKTINDFHKTHTGRVPNGLGDPVKWVRANYIPHAIETKAQQAYVQSFDSSPVLSVVVKLVTPREVIREVRVVEAVYLSPLQWVKDRLVSLSLSR